MKSKFVRYVKANPNFNHACVSEPEVGTIGVLGTNPDCPEDRVVVDFFGEDLGYTPSDEYIITLFVLPENLEATNEAHPVMKNQRLHMSNYYTTVVDIDHSACPVPVDSKNLAGHATVNAIIDEELGAAAERIKARLNDLPGVSVRKVDPDETCATTTYDY